MGGNYDILFVETPLSQIAFIYESLHCLHSLQPRPTTAEKTFQLPTVPALKEKGFVTWETIQLLLGPEEHVPFLQNAVKQFDIVDPVDGTKFPKILPKQAFPDEPDREMLEWYEEVSEKLKKDAEAVQLASRADDIQASDGAPLPRLSSESEFAEERVHAARYFEDPLYRRERYGPEWERLDRPGMPRRRSRQSPPSTRERLTEKGKDLMDSVRHLIGSPTSSRRRRRSLPDRPYEGEEYYRDSDATPTGLYPHYAPARRSSRQRSPSLESFESDEESLRRTSPRRRRRSEDLTPEEGPGRPPVIRHRRSHDQPASPNEYFPAYTGPRRHSEVPPSGVKDGFAPSQAPPFVQQVASMQGPGGPIPPGAAGPSMSPEARRPSIVDPPRAERPMSVYASNSAYSGRPTALRYTKRGSADSGRDGDRLYLDGRERRDSRGRVYPDGRDRPVRTEYARAPRSSDRFEAGRRFRSQSEDPRSPFEEERARNKKSVNRYVTPQEGVGGRRYAVPEWR